MIGCFPLTLKMLQLQMERYLPLIVRLPNKRLILVYMKSQMLKPQIEGLCQALKEKARLFMQINAFM